MGKSLHFERFTGNERGITEVEIVTTSLAVSCIEDDLFFLKMSKNGQTLNMYFDDETRKHLIKRLETLKY